MKSGHTYRDYDLKKRQEFIEFVKSCKKKNGKVIVTVVPGCSRKELMP